MRVLDNLDKNILMKSNKTLHSLLLALVKSNKGGKKNTSLKVRTGKLRASIKPVLVVNGDSLELNIEVIDYYKYLDSGTKHISNPWFFTKDLVESKEFTDIIQECYVNAFENTLKLK